MVQIDQLVQKNDKFQTRGQTLTDGIQEVGGLFLLISSKIWGNYCIWSFLTFAVVKNALIKIIHERVLVL